MYIIASCLEVLEILVGITLFHSDQIPGLGFKYKSFN